MARHIVLVLMLAVAPSACGNDGSDPAPDAAADAGDTAVDVGDTARDVGDTALDGDVGEPPEGIEVVRLEYELADQALLLDGTSLDAVLDVDPDTGDVSFAATAPIAAELARGRVLVAGMSDMTPRGLLVTVTDVEIDGERVVAHTQPASLAHAFHSLDVEIRGPLPGGDAWPGGDAKDSSSSSASIPFGGDIDWIVFDGDGDDATDEDRVRVHGRLAAQAMFTLSFGYNLDILGDINPFEIPPDLNPVDVDLWFDLSLDLSADVDITAEGQASLSYEYEYPFPDVPLPPFGVGPLVFTPMLRSTGRIEGGAPGDFVMRSGFEAGLGGGVTYAISSGVEPHLNDPWFTPTTPSADVEIAANGRVSVDVEVDLLLYGIIGPKAGVQGWAAVAADVHDDPCWHADVGVDAFAGVNISLFSVRLVDWDHTWPVASTEVASGDCPIGASFDPPPPWSVSVDEALSYTFAPDDATSWVVRAIDGTMLVAGQGSRGLYKLDAEGELVWARAWRDVDAVLPDLLRIQAVAARTDVGMLAATDRDALLWLDAAGHLQAARRIDAGSANALSFDGAATAGGGTVLLATPWRQADGAPRDIALLRAHADHTVDGWRWGDPAWDDVPHELVPWGTGFALTVTSTNYAESPSTLSWLLRLDAAGALLDAWRLAPCDGDDDLVLRAAVETDDGHLVLGGYQRFSAPRAALVNLDTDGVVDWATLNRTADLLGYDVTGLAQFESGSWLAVGTRMYPAPDDLFVARTDSAGRFVWVRSMGGAGAEEAPDVLANDDGSAVVVASSDSFGEGIASWWLTRLDVRDGAIAFDAADPVRVYDDTFVAEDACVSSTSGPVDTLPLVVSTADAVVNEEAAPGSWRRLQ